MENIKKEERKTWKRLPEELPLIKQMVRDNINRLQMALRGEALQVREALDIISLATSLAGFHLDREDITVFIEGCDGRVLWEAEIGDFNSNIIYYDMYIRKIYAHDGDCTIVLHDYTEEEEEDV